MSPLCIICNHGFSVINFVHVNSIGGKRQRVALGLCGGKGLFCESDAVVCRSNADMQNNVVCAFLLIVWFCCGTIKKRGET